MAPYFSIIVPDFHGVVNHERRQKCIENLRNSSFSDFECLWLHDGRLPRHQRDKITSCFDSDERFVFRATRARANDWGHSLRDLGIKSASGKYIVHLNADNLLYPDALETIHRYSLQPPVDGTFSLPGEGERLFYINPEVLIFGIRMMGCASLAGTKGFVRFKGSEDVLQLVFPGWPPERNRLDAMQLVATREIWLNEGGWWDKSEESDGNLLPMIAENHGYLLIPEILGEHF